MRFNMAALALASGLTSAAGIAPVAKIIHNQTSFRQQNLEIVRQLPEACSVAACLNLTAQLTCIANALTNGDPVALQKCLTTTMSQLCSCVACYPTLNNMLVALGICPVSNNEGGDKSSSR
ncbi:hypothetical protein PENCOP_c001G03410 [Penicillium coprophilum]|uniref:Fungal calcium binding protein domain-containing protein n=1 Tax=Penicillium coprophilum TaxID=36646 RepID=A0A1V6V6Y6_9EURO|nr:hypothetical protein PENCOP_c001G03410 [Penicillium coprophilum]